MWTNYAYYESKIPLNGEHVMTFSTKNSAPEWSRSQPCGVALMLLPNVRLHHRRRWLLYNFEHLAANQSFASSPQHGNKLESITDTQPASTLVFVWWNMGKSVSELVTSWTSAWNSQTEQNGTWNHPKLLLNNKNWRQCVGNGSATKLLLQQFLCFLPAACYFGST